MKYIYVVVLVQIVSLVIGILIAVFDKKTCLSKSCKELSDAIKQNLDTSVRPCDDFYQFTCGKMIDGNDTQRLGLIGDTLNAQLDRISKLLREDLRSAEPESYAKAKKIFKKCTEDDASNEEKVRRIRVLFAELGGFPVFEGGQWNETGWTWLDTMRKIRQRGLFCDSLFTLGITPNPSDHKTYLTINNPVFPEFQPCADNLQVCRQYLFAYYFYNVSLQFGVSIEQARKAADEIYGLESELWELSKNHSAIEFHMVDETSGRNLTNMTASFGYIDWPKLVGIMLQRDVPSMFKILVLNTGYMEGLKTIFHNTPNKVMANYMMWKVLQMSIAGLSLYPGNKTGSACLTFVRITMVFMVSPLYLENYPDPRGSDLDTVVEMVDLLKDEILAAIEKAAWMSDRVKAVSARKITSLRQTIGDLKVLNKSFAEEFYRGLSVEGDAFEAMSRAIMYVTDKVFDVSLGWSAVFCSLFGMQEYAANAFYMGMDNSFHVLHGILQKYVFDPRWPVAVNFGRIGSTLGHELTHALGEVGSRYDEHGTLKDTWDRDTHEKFNKTSHCLADQFDTFYNGSPFISATFSGSYMLEENMADTGGSSVAFRAYRKYSDARFWPDLLLPGLDYSSDQLFFINYAFFWCSRTTEKDTTDNHAPDRYRVLKTLRNNPYFARVFGCRQDDGMSSGIKCDVW